MQIVIEIPKEKYLGIINRAEEILDESTFCSPRYLYKAVLNGTPLPKGHGELKDIGKCDRKLFYQQCGDADSLITVKTAFDMLLSLPTIIEADTESEE